MNCFHDRQLCSNLSETHTLAQVTKMVNSKSYKKYEFNERHTKKFVKRWYYHNFKVLGHFHDNKRGKSGRKKITLPKETVNVSNGNRKC